MAFRVLAGRHMLAGCEMKAHAARQVLLSNPKDEASGRASRVRLTTSVTAVPCGVNEAGPQGLRVDDNSSVYRSESHSRRLASTMLVTAARCSIDTLSGGFS